MPILEEEYFWHTGFYKEDELIKNLIKTKDSFV